MSRFLERALELATESAKTGGGPFGAVVVQDGVVIAEGSNRVTRDHDPTAHAEVVAIRAACAKVGSHDLGEAVLYTSCEPCPMCLGAALWSGVRQVVFAATRHDAADAGFADAEFYREITCDPAERKLPMQHDVTVDFGRPFRAWAANEDRVPY